MEIYHAGRPTETQFTVVSIHAYRDSRHVLAHKFQSVTSSPCNFCPVVMQIQLDAPYCQRKWWAKTENWSREHEVQQGHAEFLRGCFCTIKLRSFIYSVTLIRQHRSHPLALILFSRIVLSRSQQSAHLNRGLSFKKGSCLKRATCFVLTAGNELKQWRLSGLPEGVVTTILTRDWNEQPLNSWAITLGAEPCM